MPPALVATVPPTVADPREARSTPYRNPAASACACSAAIVTPAPATTDPAARSTTPRSVNLPVDKITGNSPAVLARVVVGGCSGWDPPEPPATGAAAGTEPATSPVFPPCGTTAPPCSAQ